MAGYLHPGFNTVTGMSYNALLFCKTNIGGYFFDGFTDVSHSKELEITTNPVESGSAIADHAYVKPTQLSIKVLMSDVHRSLIKGQFNNAYSRSVGAWRILRDLQANRIPVTVMTRLDVYKNMLISKIETTDTYETFNGLVATVSLVEIPVARVKTVKISSQPQTTTSTSVGSVEAETVNESILYQLLSTLGYKTS